MFLSNKELFTLFILLYLVTIYYQRCLCAELVLSLLKMCQTWVNYFGICINIIIFDQQNYSDIIHKKQMVIIKNPALDEASGLVASRKNKGIMYSHNDSDGNATIHILDTNGRYLGRIVLDSIIAIDFEDIAIGPSSIHDRDYIYLGDIGNNWNKRKHISIYKFLEPRFTRISYGPKVYQIPPEEIVKIELEYPDSPKDFETQLLDPLSNDIYLIEKNWFGRNALMYKFSQPSTFKTGIHHLNLTHVGRTKGWMITSGDVSSDGQKIIIRNYQGAWLFNRKNNESLDELLKRKADCYLLLQIEKQGESISFSHDGSGFYTTSEGRNPPLHGYEFVKNIQNCTKFTA